MHIEVLTGDSWMVSNMASKMGSMRARGGVTPHILTRSMLAREASSLLSFTSTYTRSTFMFNTNIEDKRTFSEAEKFWLAGESELKVNGLHGVVKQSHHQWNNVVKDGDCPGVMHGLKKPLANRNTNPEQSIPLSA